MMEILKFNTQICTTIEQSKRLLELGLKPETADMHYVRKTIDAMGYHIDDDFKEPRYGNVNSKYAKYAVMNFSNYETLPAWSLHRLIELYKDVEDTSMWSLENVNYNRLIQCIGLAIKHDAFNKYYLK